MHINRSTPTPENSEKTVIPAIIRRAISEISVKIIIINNPLSDFQRFAVVL